MIRPSLFRIPGPGSRVHFPVGAALAVLMLVAAAVAYVQLDRMVNHAGRLESHLTTLGAHLSDMNALKWQAAATKSTSDRLPAQLDQARTGATGAIHSLVEESGGGPMMTRLDATFHEYASSIGIELSLLRQGRMEEAIRLDAVRVDPAYEALSDAIGGLRVRFRAEAVRAGRFALAGSLFSVFVALVAIGYLSWHVQSARRAGAVAKAEQRVWQEGERRYRDLVEANPHPMWVVDRATLRILAVNAAAVDVFGYSRGEFLNLTLRDLRPFEEQDTLLAEIRAEGSSGRRGEPVRHRKRNGDVILAEVSTRSLPFSGHDAAVSLVQDITERIRLEEGLRQNQRLEAVARLAGGVAHDFNNILTSIGGYAQLLAGSFADDAHRKQRKYAEDILASTRRAAGLTQQLLAYSRRQVLRAEVLDVNAFLAAVQHTIRPVAGNAIRVEVRRAPDVWPVKVDRVQLEQVLVSLAGNARDTMTGGGNLILESANVSLPGGDGDIPPGDYVSISVTDDGPGLSEAARARIFDPFRSEPAEGPGLGLGLAIVDGIVKQSGGFVRVDAAPDRGTTFRLYFPRTEASAHAPAPEEAQPQPGRVPTVLLVDGDVGMRQLASQVLLNAGYAVLEAEDGTRGIEVAERFAGAIDLVMTDVRMDGMSGPDMVRRLREARPSVGVLYTSGDAGPSGDGSRTAVLCRPFTLDGLTGALRELLDEGRRAA